MTSHTDHSLRRDAVSQPSPDPGNATLFGLVRHAETMWNRERRIQGSNDSPLTEQGRREASQWGALLQPQGWQRILASDLGRTRATVKRLNRHLDLPIRFDPRLRELDWGEWTGRCIDDLVANCRDEVDASYKEGWFFAPPGGENRASLRNRAAEALAGAHRRWSGHRILVVCHEGVIKALIYHLLGRQYRADDPPLRLRKKHLHRIVCDAEGLHVDNLNALCLEKM